MLKERTYVEAAEEFGTPVGVAHIIGFKTKKEQIREEGLDEFNKIAPELDINSIICESVELGIYQLLQREIYMIKLKDNKRLKETTIYRRAFKNVIENEKYFTKRR